MAHFGGEFEVLVVKCACWDHNKALDQQLLSCRMVYEWREIQNWLVSGHRDLDKPDPIQFLMSLS